MGTDLLLSGNDLHEFAHFAAQITPAPLNMLNQGLGFILCQHGDLAYAGIYAIRQHEINDSKLAAKWCGRLAAPLGEGFEACASTAGHHYRQCAASQAADIASGVATGSEWHELKRATLGASPHHILVGSTTALLNLTLMAVMKLCILSSEIMPYAKTGGLADVTGALIRQLIGLKHEVRAFMPLYGTVRRAYAQLRPVPSVQQVAVTLGSAAYEFSLQADSIDGNNSQYFVDCPALFDRPNFYTLDPDEHRRFLLFTRAVLESCRLMGFSPQVFHCNDWHTAFLPLYLRTVYATSSLFKRSRSVLTIHNIGYQGVMPGAAASDIGLGAGESLLDEADLKLGFVNALKHGIRFADRVTTVSPTYAREICEEPLGMGLQTELRTRADGVLGILNGVDYRDWDPQVDPYLSAHFSPAELSGKRLNKQRLIAAMSLALPESRPLLGMVTRLAEQKGIDLLFSALPAVLEQHDCGLVVLGSGDSRYMTFFEALSRRFAHRVAFRSGYDESLAHLIEAGSDMFLMPSRYEPCGLNQMYSLRYGTIPIVRNTGGLADSVQHYDPRTGLGTGCVFNDYDASAVRWAINTAIDWFKESKGWRQLMQNAMAQDFSWDRQIGQYQALYERLSHSSST